VYRNMDVFRIIIEFSDFLDSDFDVLSVTDEVRPSGCSRAQISYPYIDFKVFKFVSR
jgi:hypothetical protein